MNASYHCIAGCRIISLCIPNYLLCHLNISRLVDIYMTNSICITEKISIETLAYCTCLCIGNLYITSMTQNRDSCRLLDLRNKLITASRDHKIYHIIKLWQSIIIIEKSSHKSITEDFTCNIYL